MHKLCSQHGLVVKSFGGPCESRGKGRARRKAREEGPRKSEAEEERSGGSEEGGTRRGRRAEAREERGRTRERGARSKEEKREQPGAIWIRKTRAFYERDLGKTLVWLPFLFEKAAKPLFWKPRGLKSTCFTSPKCFPGRSLSLLGAPGGPLGGPVGQTGPSGGTQGLQTRFLEAYMCVLYGPADVFQHVEN